MGKGIKHIKLQNLSVSEQNSRIKSLHNSETNKKWDVHLLSLPLNAIWLL